MMIAPKRSIAGMAAGIFLCLFPASARPGQPGLPALPAKDLPRVVAPSAVAGKPDLAVQIRADGLGHLSDLYPDSPGMGPSRFRVEGFVFNFGVAPVPRCEIDLFLSADRKISPDDRRIDRIAITSAVPPAGEGRVGSIVIPGRDYGIAGIPPGTYLICGRVDPARTILESREDNNDNCDGGPIRIHGPAAGK